MDNTEKWAAHNLALFLGLGEEEISQLTLPFLMQLEVQELQQTLKDMLGEADDATNFIAEFVQRRNAEICGNRRQKASTEPKLDYGNMLKSQQQPSPASKAVDTQRDNSQHNETISQQQKSTNKKSKAKSRMSLEEHRQLEKSGRLKDPRQQRSQCDCQATQHHLFTNCLSCGRVICAREGEGPCFYCNNPVVSRQQQVELCCGRVDPKALQRAVEFKARLLEYDRNLSKRTTVLDAKGDFGDMDGGLSTRWLNTREKERIELRNKALIEQVAGPESRIGKSYTIDIDLERVQVTTSAIQPKLAVEATDNADESDKSSEALASYHTSSQVFRNEWVEDQGIRPVYVKKSQQLLAEEHDAQKRRKAPKVIQKAVAPIT